MVYKRTPGSTHIRANHRIWVLGGERVVCRVVRVYPAGLFGLQSRAMHVRRIGPVLGAEVTGADFGDLEASATVDALKQLLAAHELSVFPDAQDTKPEEHMVSVFRYSHIAAARA